MPTHSERTLYRRGLIGGAALGASLVAVILCVAFSFMNKQIPGTLRVVNKTGGMISVSIDKVPMKGGKYFLQPKGILIGDNDMIDIFELSIASPRP